MLLPSPCRQPLGDATALESKGFSAVILFSPRFHTDATANAAAAPHSADLQPSCRHIRFLISQASKFPGRWPPMTVRWSERRMAKRDVPNLLDHLDAVRRYARVAGDAAHVDDLVQECLTQALSCPHAWRDVRGARSALLTMLHNMHVDDDGHRGPDSAGAPAQSASLMLRDLVRALQALPEPRRRIVLLTALDGMSYQEVADLLDVPVGAVMSRLAGARDLLGEATDEGDPLAGMDEGSGRRGLAPAA
jgi:RNA polymerase sigma-70 factor (ECF subfamily)